MEQLDIESARVCLGFMERCDNGDLKSQLEQIGMAEVLQVDKYIEDFTALQSYLRLAISAKLDPVTIPPHHGPMYNSVYETYVGQMRPMNTVRANSIEALAKILEELSNEIRRTKD